MKNFTVFNKSEQVQQGQTRLHITLVNYTDETKTSFEDQVTVQTKDKAFFDSIVTGAEYKLVKA